MIHLVNLIKQSYNRNLVLLRSSKSGTELIVRLIVNYNTPKFTFSTNAMI